MKQICSILLILIMFSGLIYGAENKSRKKLPKLNKVSALSDVWFDVNRMNGVYRNNGTWLYDNIAGDWGLEWPKGSGLSPMFACGQWLGAIVDGEVRVAGVQHDATEFWAGEITAPFEATSSRASQYRWYELHKGGVKPDGSADDYNDWPVDQGAPVDEDGKPLLLGDRTMFCVYNDLADHSLYGSNKLSAEVRQTVFAFNRADALGDMQFVKWQLVNKSGMDWDSTYFCIWADPDIGNADDDFVGCDQSLGLGYCYNADDDDQNYGAAPPAIGIDFFQGPIIGDPDSTVTLPDGTELPGKKMLKMTSFIYYDNNDSPHGNPNNAGDIWNYFRGYWQDYNPITFGGRGLDPTGTPTQFMFSGDPETGNGWLDSEAADRRFIMTTGPFDMPPWEDTNGNGLPDFGEPGVQEVVAAVIVARGSSNLNSVTQLKTVDALAQLAYDASFKMAESPAQPVVDYTEFANKVVLNWDNRSEFLETGDPYTATDPGIYNALGNEVIIDNEVKVIDDADYNFYGYSVYQYADASGRDPVLVDHWDVGGVKDAVPYTGKRFIEITENKNPAVGPKGDRLINGKEYFFGVEAEAYLEFGGPVILKSPPQILTVIPQYKLGMRYAKEHGDSVRNVSHNQVDPSLPSCDGDVIVRVIDPAQVTGHDYEIYFDEQHYYRDKDGAWKFTNYPDSVGKLAKPGDVSPSTLTASAVYAVEPGTIELIFGLDLVSPTDAWVDGIKITFPDDISFNRIDAAHSGFSGNQIDYVIEDDKTIFWGRNDTTQGGYHSFVGGELLTLNVEDFTPPMTVDFIIYDDGWGSGGNPINATGTITIDEIGYEFKTEQHWNLYDVDLSETVLADQSTVFPGSENSGDAGSIADGLQIIVKASYEAPTDFIGVGENNWGDVEGAYDIDSYGAHGGWGDWGPTGRAVDNFTDEYDTDHGNGVTDLNVLVQDYELRFTGEYADSTVTISDGDTIVYYPVAENTGQMATMFGARNHDIEDNPLNPNPGSDDPFLVRIPFEVWNVTTNQQVNILIYDRMQSLPDSSRTVWYAFNPNDRMYCWIDNSAYDPDTPNSANASNSDTDSLTWNLVFWECLWEKGDVLEINYANPIQLGNDKFSFSTDGMAPTNEIAAQKSDFEQIKVVPNPYYGSHSGEMDPFHRWVQFTHLPDECTIRIFDLAGNLVRKMEKPNDGSSLFRWDLQNRNGLPVASGIYVFHIEADKVGEKVGKIAIFTPNERLDTW